METNPMLIAPCGMNCGVCMAHLRKRNTCPGCRYPDDAKPKTRVFCKIKTCKFFRDGKAAFCFECHMFPCDTLKHLDARYRMKYHMSMIGNLENIRRFGLRAFIKEESKRWTCPACNGTICVHKHGCISCGNAYEQS